MNRCVAYGSILQGSWKTYWSPGIGNCCSNVGVSISINSRWKEEVMNYVEVIPGRSQYIVIKIKDLTFGVLNIYAPNQVAERIEFWSSLTNRLPTLDSWCMAGDFNMIERIDDRRVEEIRLFVEKNLHVGRDFVLSLE